ncbi:hypothetical protein DITRI_Ditri04bG0134900 [Diplodiscus trichospermus]
MEGAWTIFCSNSESSHGVGKTGSRDFSAIVDPYTCINHTLIISTDILLLLIFLSIIIYRLSLRKVRAASQSQHLSSMLILSAVFNGILVIAYFISGIWIVKQKLNTDQTILPLHDWLIVLFQGLTWLLLGLIVSLKKQNLPCITAVKTCSILGSFYAGFLCIAALRKSIVEGTWSAKIILDILSFPGSILLILCSFTGHKSKDTDLDNTNDACYEPLQGAEPEVTDGISFNRKVTTFAKAGFFSTMSFWWLNPLMKQGNERILEDQDIPLLQEEYRAEKCYSKYMEQLGKEIKKGSSDMPLRLSLIFCSHWKAILVSGFFALIKVLTLSMGPLFLRAFIEVAEGKEVFKHEGYALAVGLFLTKCLESFSGRQWFFQTRIVGLQIRSLLSAAIYQKQLRVSNAAKMTHSPREIVNYVSVDTYKIGEFPSWLHQIWSTSLQLCLALFILYYTVGLATVAALIAIILTVLASSPLAKLLLKYQKKLMLAQDKRLKAITEALGNMKVLKLYAWETHFKNVIEGLRKEELKWISGILMQRGFQVVLFWSSPVIIPAVTFWTCYFLRIQLNAGNIFTFLASLNILQEPIRVIPDVFKAFIEAKVSLDRIVKFLQEPELENKNLQQEHNAEEFEYSIFISSTEISWDAYSSSKPTLRNVNLAVKPREKITICGEVGSGKSTLLAAILGEVPKFNGIVDIHGKIAYVSQTTWIQTGSIRENILFGSVMDPVRYQEVLEKCCLLEDLEMLPFGDLTEIGERGVNLSGGQKQRVQLARALYQDADIYLLDDPFSAVDAHTATSLFNEYFMGALSGKTVLLVTHQMCFLPAFDSILLMAAGEIIEADTYHNLLASSQEFQNLVNAHNTSLGSEIHINHPTSRRPMTSKKEIQNIYVKDQSIVPSGEQLIKLEKQEKGDTGLKPYKQYLSHDKCFLYFSFAALFHMIFIIGQVMQNYWLAANVQNSSVSRLKLVAVYTVIGSAVAIFLFLRSFSVVLLGCGASQSIFSTLLKSLFRAPMSFYDSTPLGRILSRVSSDSSIVDLEVPFRFAIALGSTLNAYSSFFILAILAWPVVFVIIPLIYLSIFLQRYYLACSMELKRINGTTKSLVASHLAESIAGASTIRAFGERDRFFLRNLNLINADASSDFHSFSANEWLIQRLEIPCALVLSLSALAMTLLPVGASASGFIGMALSYGLSLNLFLVVAIQYQCVLANLIVSVERLKQYMHIPSEAPEVIEDNQPAHCWPSVGKVEICNLKVRYQPNAPLVLKGITCIFEGGQKIGIVGRTGSGKTTLISALFRLVEPSDGKIIIDDINVSTIGLPDLRSRLGIIPQDPTLFSGSLRYNLDPLSEHSDYEIWEVLEKCQLREVVQEKEKGLNSLAATFNNINCSYTRCIKLEHGSETINLSGTRFVEEEPHTSAFDEATASIDNATDSIIQKTIRTELADCTVITVAHRIPTVMDCTMVLGISDGKLIEYDEPSKLMNKQGSLFGQLVKEYWSRSSHADIY